MEFPEHERVVYHTNPLVEVVCQLRFHQVFAIDETVPAGFQRDLGQDYPKASTRVSQTFQINGGPSDARPPAQRTLYDFQNEPEDIRVTLASDFLAISSPDYIRWESFEKHVLAAMEALLKNYPVVSFTRVGLRYVNLIDRDKLGLEVTWDQLIRRSALGLLADDEVPLGDLTEHSNTSIFRLKDGMLALRQGLRLKDGKPDGSYLIDSDIFTDQGVATDGNVTDLLRGYNTTARNAFRWLITQQLHERLGPNEPGA
ncbi:TIGR04255 family protein [Roseovarius sp.]|uniref:TIGR04255 family protein n=1 Tax=Roseovarius sp. TaxID=1486281 RepID=UPI003A969C7B